MTSLARLAGLLIAFSGSAALADIDYFGRGPTDPTDDTLLELIRDPNAPLQARQPQDLKAEIRATGLYGLESSLLGANFDASLTLKYKAVAAWTPMLSITLRGSALLEDSRSGSGDVGLRVSPSLCAAKKDKVFAFDCYVQVKATGLGDSVGGSADIGAKYRLIDPVKLDFSLSAGPRVGELGWGYGSRIAAGYGHSLPRGMLLSLTAIMSAGAKTFVLPIPKAGAELVFQPLEKLKLAVNAQQPVFVSERPIEVGGWIAYTF